MRKTLFAFALLLSLNFAFAQKTINKEVDGPPEVQARYEVLDVMNSKSHPVEIWTLRFVSASINSKTYRTEEVTKEAFVKNPAPRVETHKIWSREVRSARKDTYLKENFIDDPSDLKPGQRTFGFVEERRISDDVVVGSWPIFYTIGAKDGLKAIISHTFEPGNVQRMTVLECDGLYFFPLRENNFVFKDRKMTEHTLYIRQD